MSSGLFFARRGIEGQKRGVSLAGIHRLPILPRLSVSIGLRSPERLRSQVYPGTKRPQDVRRSRRPLEPRGEHVTPAFQVTHVSGPDAESVVVERVGPVAVVTLNRVAHGNALGT